MTTESPTPLPRQRAHWLLALHLLGLGGSALARDEASATGWRLSAHSVRHCDALALHRLNDDDALAQVQPRSGKNLTYIDEEVRASVQHADWQWSVLLRQSGTLVTSADALRLAALLTRGDTPSSDQHWDNTVQLNQFVGYGLELGRAFVPAAGWRAQGRLQLLQLQHWRERRLSGPAEYDAQTGTYAFQLQSHQADDRLNFPFQRPRAAAGWGLLWGAELQWQDAQWRLQLAARDLGWLRWNQLPQQELALNSDTQATDSNGYLIYLPLVQGHNSQAGYHARQTGWWQAQLAYAMQPGQALGLGADRAPGYGWLPRLDWQQPPSDAQPLGWSMSYRLHEKRLELAGQWQGLSLQVGADRSDAQARSRSWLLSYGHSW